MSDLPTYKILKNDYQGVVAEYNTTVKVFPDGKKHIRYTSFSNLKGQGRVVVHNGSSTEEEIERYNTINLLRRRTNISDLAYANACVKPWEYFVTLTFDDNFVENSYSHEKVTKYLSNWLHYQKKKNPSMRYLIVPELHKSGRIHFHGVFSDVKNWRLSPAVNSKTGEYIYQNGSQVFNLDNYKLGFTTVSKVKNIEAVSHYISKYITKELLNLKHKKNVWHSKNLIKPKTTYHLVKKEDINSYIENNNYNIDYEANKTLKNYEKKYISISSYNVYYVNFCLLRKNNIRLIFLYYLYLFITLSLFKI